MNSVEILDKLIAFPTISRESNMDIIHFIEDYLANLGIESILIYSEDKQNANLYATIGPKDKPGFMLSGHTDVVPVAGQNWSSDPFIMRNADGRLYGRGACDMKGFIACCLSMAAEAVKKPLTTPIHLAFSYDEEIGCIGVRSMVDMLSAAPIKPMMCIVGEPTNLQIATGHKGKVGMRATCTGRESHSALAPFGLNAIYLASEFITALRALQDKIIAEYPQDDDYDVPYSTLHVGIIKSGTALNIVPNTCTLDFEIRNIAEDDPMVIYAEIEKAANAVTDAYKDKFPEAAIDIEIFNTYPGMKKGSPRTINWHLLNFGRLELPLSQ